MSHLHAVAVAARRFFARRPWVYWALVTLAAAGATTSMLERASRIDDARAAWGDTVDVWVASVAHAPGDPISAERRAVPEAMVSADAIDGAPANGAVARQRISAGELLHRVDVAATDGPQLRTPPGSLAVPVVESPPSGALIGDRVRVVADGSVLAGDATVVGRHGDVTLVAVPAAEAVVLPAAADAGRVTLLLVP